MNFGFLSPKERGVNSHCVILLVEDDENDAFFVRRTLSKLEFPGRVEHVWDAESARRYLTGAKPFQDREQYPIPDLIITDSSLLERNSGVEFLEWVRRQLVFADVPLILYSGALSPEQCERAEKAGVTGVLTKSSDTAAMKEHMLEILSHLPPSFGEWLK
jgi:CheY-like chemotaxis protein